MRMKYRHIDSIDLTTDNYIGVDYKIAKARQRNIRLTASTNQHTISESLAAIPHISHQLTLSQVQPFNIVIERHCDSVNAAPHLR